MGKVRRLRKKYKELCSKKALNENFEISVISSNRNAQKSKGKKPCTNEFPKKRQDVRRNTLLNRIHECENLVQYGSNSEITSEVDLLQLNDNLPLIKKNVGSNTPNNDKKLKVKVNIKRPPKKISKIRSNNLMRDIYCFKKTLQEETFLKNPQNVVMNHTMEKLGAECLLRVASPYHN